MNISEAIMKYEPDIVRHIQELVRIRSVAEPALPGKPFGEGVDRALQYMLSLGEQLGFTSTNIDGYAGHVEYGTGDEIAGILVHLDTVPEGTGWTVDPLGGEMIDGRIYGRGTADDKAPAVVALFAMKAFADLGIAAKRRLRVILGTNEENGMTDMDYYFAKEPVPDMAFSPDAGYPIINAEKGYYVLKLKWSAQAETALDQANGWQLVELDGGVAPNVVPENCTAIVRGDADTLAQLVRAAAETERVTGTLQEDGTLLLAAIGKSGHGAYPPSGINAIAHMADFLHRQHNTAIDQSGTTAYIAFLAEKLGFDAFGEALGIAFSDDTHGKLTVNFAEARWSNFSGEVVLNIRVPVTTDCEAVVSTLQDKLRAFNIGVSIEAHLPPLYVPAESPLIKRLSRAYELVTGDPTKLLSIGGGTYARKLQGRGVAFGAGFPGGPNLNVHQPDEFIVIADIMRHGKVCTQAIYELVAVE